MRKRPTDNLTHNLVLPTLLFASLGGMTWAVRGSSGYGGMMGCIFAGVMWGTAWWFIAREPGPNQSRRYTSGWIILAMTFGVGISGARGWMQWSSFFEGRLQTNYGAGEFVQISPAYGFVWLFIAGMPWAGIGACMLAWCGSRRPTTIPREIGLWAVRIAAGVGAVVFARYLFDHFPQWFLPLYESMEERYKDFDANPNLRRLINDNRNAVSHMALYLAFLGVEAGRRDWRNVVLILTVGVVNGAGWAALQNWKWADDMWPGVSFNWWRCWETSGGISIGIAYGLAYYLVNRPQTDEHKERSGTVFVNLRPNLERLGACLGLILGLGYSIRSGLKGWANIYAGNEDYWEAQLTAVGRPTMLVLAAGAGLLILVHRLARNHDGDVFPRAYALVWMVLIVQNILAQLVTGPFSNWNETVFNIYYLLLFALSAVIVHHYHRIKAVRYEA